MKTSKFSLSVTFCWILLIHLHLNFSRENGMMYKKYNIYTGLVILGLRIVLSTKNVIINGNKWNRKWNGVYVIHNETGPEDVKGTNNS